MTPSEAKVTQAHRLPGALQALPRRSEVPERITERVTRPEFQLRAARPAPRTQICSPSGSGGGNGRRVRELGTGNWKLSESVRL